MNENEVIKRLISAIEGSGKEILEIDKGVVMEYLQRIGIDGARKRDEIYNELLKYAKKKKQSIQSTQTKIDNLKNIWSDTDFNEINKESAAEKARNSKVPRKSIFGEIVKITN